MLLHIRTRLFSPFKARDVSDRLGALTGIRFIAALLVICYHYAPTSVRMIPVLGELASHGYMAVNFFFILSGFVLTYAYRAPKPDQT